MPGRCYFRIQDGSDPDVESAAVKWYDLMIWEDGVRKNRSNSDPLEYDVSPTTVGGLESVSFGAGSKMIKYVNGAPESQFNDFNAAGGLGASLRKSSNSSKNFDNIKHLSPFNTYNKRIDHGDLEAFAGVVGRTYGAYKMYSQLHDVRAQALVYNRSIEEAHSEDKRLFEAWHANPANSEATLTSNAKTEWKNRLTAWQENEYTRDIAFFSNEGAIDDLYPDPNGGGLRPLTSVEMIFSALMREISPDVVNFWDPDVANMTFWNFNPEALLGFPTEAEGGPGPWEMYKPPTFKPPTKPVKGTTVKVPSDTWEKLAKGYFIAEICLMGVVALLHLYDSVKGDSDATIRSTGWQVPYGPSLIQNHDGDGVFGRYMKQTLRARDVLGNVRSMVTAVFSGLAKAFGWVASAFGDNGCKGNTQCERAQADAHKIGMAAIAETIKGWRKSLRGLLDAAVGQANGANSRPIQWYEKDMLQHYAALEKQISTNMQVLAQLENIGAQYWPKTQNGTFPYSAQPLTTAGQGMMRWPCILRVNIMNPGVWGYIQSVEILDPGMGAEVGSGQLSIGNGLTMSGVGRSWGPSEAPKIFVKFEGGKAVAVRFESVETASGELSDKAGKGFYSPPALVVDPSQYGGFKDASRGGMPVELGWQIAVEEEKGEAANDRIKTIKPEEGKLFNHPAQKNQMMMPNSSAAQMAHKYEVLYKFAKDTLKSARRGIECRFLSRKDESGALDNVFKDGNDADIHKARQHSRTPGPQTEFEQLEMNWHDRDTNYYAKDRYGNFENAFQANKRPSDANQPWTNGGALLKFKNPDKKTTNPLEASCVKGYYALQCGTVGNTSTADPVWRSRKYTTRVCFSRGWGEEKRAKTWRDFANLTPAADMNGTVWSRTYQVNALSVANETDFYPYTLASQNVHWNDFSGWGITCYGIRGQILYGSWTEYQGRGKTIKHQPIPGYDKKLRTVFGNKGGTPNGSLLAKRVAEGIDEIYVLSWKPGYCSENEIKNFSKNLSEMFFDDVAAYNVSMREQRHKEAVCDQRACGAMHAYSNVPSLGESLKENACGNVEIMVNFHPDTSRKVLDTLSNSFWKTFITGINAPIKAVCFPNYVPSTYWPGKDIIFGTTADLTLPPIFANWTVIKTPTGTHADDRAGAWKRLLRGLGEVLTVGMSSRVFGEHYKTTNPIIDHRFPPNGYARQLVSEYHSLRMYKNDYNGVKSTMRKLLDDGDSRAAMGNQGGGEDFTQTEAGKMITTHVDFLGDYYKAWAEETGVGHSIEPVNHESRRFSGVCNPIIKNTGIHFAPFLFGISGKMPSIGGKEYEWMGAPGLGKRYQEIGLTDPETFKGTHGVDKTSKHFRNINPDLDGDDSNGSLAGSTGPANLNEKSEKQANGWKEYISETFPSQGEWRDAVNNVDLQLGAFSAMLPQCIVKDLSYHTWHRPYDNSPITTEGWSEGEAYKARDSVIWDGSSNGNNFANITSTDFTCLVDHTPETLISNFAKGDANDGQGGNELGYAHEQGGRPWLGATLPNNGTNEYWEICTACGESKDIASGVMIDEKASFDLGMDYSGYKLALLAGGLEAGTLTEEKILAALYEYGIKTAASWTAPYANHYITGEQTRNPHDTYEQATGLFADYGKYVNQYHYRGIGKGIFTDTPRWDVKPDGSPLVYSGSGYDCDMVKAKENAYVDLSGSSDFVPNVTPIPFTIIHGRVLKTGATDAESGILGDGGYVSTEIKLADQPCGSRWNEAAGTGRWDPAPPCLSPLKHTFNLTGIGTDCAAAEAAVVTARLTHEGQSPLGLYQNSGCGFTWQDQKELSADWPTSWVGTGVDVETARNEIMHGDSTATPGTPPNSGYLNWQNYIQYHHFVPETPDNIGFYNLLGVPACVPGVDKGAWQGYIEALPSGGPQLTCTAYPPTSESWDGTYSASLSMYATIQGFGAFWPNWNASSLTYEQLRMVSGTYKSVAYETINRELQLGQDHAGDPGKYDVTTANGITTSTRSTETLTNGYPNGTFVDVPVCLYPTRLPVTEWGGEHPTLMYYTGEGGGWKNLIVGNLKDHSEVAYENAAIGPAQSGNATGHSFAAAEAMEYGDNGDGTYYWAGAAWFTSICGFPQRGAGVECVLDTDCACVKSLEGEAEQAYEVDGETVTWKETATGQNYRNNWRYYLPVYKNVYSGMFVVSGEYPVVTGTCDWSATKRQAWKEEKYPPKNAAGFEHSMAGQTMWSIDETKGDNGLVNTPEMYMGVYEDAQAVVHTGISGLSASQLRSRHPKGLSPNAAPLSKPSKKDDQIADYGPMNTGVRDVMFVYAQGTNGGSYGEAGGDAAFMMGRPLINQEFSETAHLATKPEYDVKTPFGYVVILLDDKTTWHKTQKSMSPGSYNDAVLANPEPPKAATTLEKVIREGMGIADGRNQIQWRVTESISEFDTNVSQASVLQNIKKSKSFIRTINCPQVKGRKRLVMMFAYQNAAAACDSCVSHKIGAEGFPGGEATAGQEMFIFNENQKMGMGATWELRSGDWNFSVPYTVDRQTLKDPRGYKLGDLAGESSHNNMTIDILPWIETIKYAFPHADGLYTGQESFWALPGSKLNFEIGCNLDNHKSKLDKIIDYQHEFKAGGSYEVMKNKVKNPDGTLKTDGTREWSALPPGGATA
jgi:hypothetical protein